MIEVEINEDIKTEALRRDNSYGSSFKGASIPDGKGRFYGFLGEEIVRTTYKYLSFRDQFDYDFEFKKYKFDVKTKTRNSVPKYWYDATIDKSAEHQNTDFYIFVQILAPRNLINLSQEEIRNYHYEKAWIIGYISKKDFFKSCRVFKAGETDPSNGVTYRDDINLIKYDDLKCPRYLKETFIKYR